MKHNFYSVFHEIKILGCKLYLQAEAINLVLTLFYPQPVEVLQPYKSLENELSHEVQVLSSPRKVNVVFRKMEGTVDISKHSSSKLILALKIILTAFQHFYFILNVFSLEVVT